MNSFTFTGNLGADGELRYTAGGQTAVLSFSVGFTSGFGQNEATSWARCTVWGKRAEALEVYMKKGQCVSVTGELTHRRFEGNQGTAYSLDVRVDRLKLIGRAEGSPAPAGAAAPPPQSAGQARGPSPAPAPGLGDFHDDDIPF